MLIKYYNKEFLIYSELDLKNVFKKLEIQYIFNFQKYLNNFHIFSYNFILIFKKN